MTQASAKAARDSVARQQLEAAARSLNEELGRLGELRLKRERVLAHVLDGPVIHCRGRNDSLPARPVEKRVTNNLVLKKLRVAFELKDVDLHDVFAAAGFPISKPELSALFRQPGHHNYRACGDQLLRNFLKGLTLRVRGP